MEQESITNLSTLRRSRGGFKSKLTKIYNQLTNTEQQNREKRDLTYIEYKLKEIDEYLAKAGRVHDKIEMLVTDTEFDMELEKYDEIKKLHQNIYLMLSREEISQINRTESQIQIRDSPQVKVRLPELNLPTFGGKVTEWLGFLDSFQCLVMNNSDLTDIQRFQYLKSCLTGSALAEIRNLPTTSDNFVIAWQLLTQRFQNNRAIVRSYIQDIVNVHFMSKNPSESLREMLTQLKTSVQALDALDYKTNALSEQMIIYIVESKLDDYLKEKWMECSDTQNPQTLKQLIKFLEKYCQILEIKTISNKATTIPCSPLASHETKPTCSRSSYSCVKSVICVICGENHSIYFCPVFQSLSNAERVQKVRQLNLCFNCLKGHTIKKCNSREHCKLCDKRHHSLLHKTNFRNESQTTSDDFDTRQTQIQNVLPTVVVHVKTSDGESIPVRALLDSGSEVNFISTSVFDRLGLDKKKSIQSFSGIGDQTSSADFTVQCLIHSRLSSYNTEAEFIILDKVTQTMPSSPLQWDPDLLTFSESLLADPYFYQPHSIDMLLGCEFLHVIKGRTDSQSPEFCWLESELGMIFSGRLERKPYHQVNSIANQYHSDGRRQWLKPRMGFKAGSVKKTPYQD
uniref:Peptidase aspartic putative domain-containing protein n=2 Tax=Cacopsylla melanoneura TaxID=428564 RepID=A0A8D8SX50_9HEMI